MKIALTQFAASDSPEENLNRQISMLNRAAESGAKIVCTQELFMSKYFCVELDARNFSYARSLASKEVGALSEAAGNAGVVLVASLFEDRGGGLYHNTAVVFDADGSELGIYRKAHIPHDPHFEEKYYFAPGDTGYRSWNTKYGKIGVLVCWDQWFPEAARLTALAGADIIFYPTAIGGLLSESPEEAARFKRSWQTVQRGHAVANGVYVAAANRVGVEKVSDGRDGIKVWGGSFLSNPYGEIVAEASENSEEILLADIDFSLLAEFRKTWPFFRDRRTDTYAGMLKLAED